MPGAAHQSVLLPEAVDALHMQPDGFYVDGTFGRGGHASLMLDKLNDSGRLMVMDRDPDAIAAAMEMNEELVKQIEYQESSGNVDQATAKRFGRQLGADYFLYGELTSIPKRTKRVDDIYMKFNLNLVNIETGEIEWADEKEIRKTETRGMCGR